MLLTHDIEPLQQSPRPVNVLHVAEHKYDQYETKYDHWFASQFDPEVAKVLIERNPKEWNDADANNEETNRQNVIVDVVNGRFLHLEQSQNQSQLHILIEEIGIVTPTTQLKAMVTQLGLGTWQVGDCPVQHRVNGMMKAIVKRGRPIPLGNERISQEITAPDFGVNAKEPHLCWIGRNVTIGDAGTNDQTVKDADAFAFEQALFLSIQLVISTTQWRNL